MEQTHVYIAGNCVGKVNIQTKIYMHQAVNIQYQR